jgi:hypothetical protein
MKQIFSIEVPGFVITDFLLRGLLDDYFRKVANMVISISVEEMKGEKMKDLTPEEIDELKKEVEEARKEKKEREERERFNPFGYYPSTYGWVCPVCGKGNAPWQGTCTCKDVKYSWTVNY